MENSAIGRDAIEFLDTILTPEEIEESNLRVASIGNDLPIPLPNEEK